MPSVADSMRTAIRAGALRDMIDDEAAQAGKKSQFRGIWFYKRGRSADVGPWSKPSWSAVLQDPPAGAGPTPRRPSGDPYGRNDPPFFALHGLKSEAEAAAAADYVALWMRLRCKVSSLAAQSWNLPALRLWEQPTTVRTLRGHKLADVDKARSYIRRKVAELREAGQLKQSCKRAAEPAQGGPPKKRRTVATAAAPAPPKKTAAAGKQRTKAAAAQQAAAPKRRHTAVSAVKQGAAAKKPRAAVAPRKQAASARQRQCSTLIPPKRLVKSQAQTQRAKQLRAKQRQQATQQQAAPKKRQGEAKQRREQEKQELAQGLRRMAEAQERRRAVAAQQRQRLEAAAAAARKQQAEQKLHAKQELGRQRAKRLARRAVGK